FSQEQIFRKRHIAKSIELHLKHITSQIERRRTAAMPIHHYVILFLSYLVRKSTTQTVVEYYEMKPYIYTDTKTGHLTGMLIDTFTEMNNLAVDYCNTSGKETFIKTSYEEIHDKWKLATSEQAQTNSSLNRYLFPIVRVHIANGTDSTIYASETISVIIKKFWVEGSLKFFVSLFDLQVLFSVIIVFVFLLACILFITELRKEVARGRVSSLFGSQVWLLFVT
uniref:Uncharacterized protein n=1 Tax=Clytia hemisphaerica TaxID=252671 RepID=A0A7M5TRB9_9CNID